ncbi:MULTISPECIES: peptidylprolyl isomerase [unclassified Pseudoalteromonas]|jgi:cyclophilin family peptidyl-prolyl cis-trans isomerase|uniref:peptidylprolyl isomerase n=1 Tax=unclassified Pseudoalteromonas TaxID=194690 RepID=UPI000EED4ED5|nr:MULTISPECIES: peptidylprolyl isomerase [unclassified Pseudoalteromonas]MCK8096855.1 peptidylprolyl isomerase [Pseudoalteromonas sp. 1CM17D]MCK8105689.1 peptidylprolyl isomerase [Pseudoalteromonas sp. 2CM41L]MDC9508862.1 peptidylprolyl isomerase [Pseudoalteromonas sp. Angola-4]HAG38610.1 peptidylprolyl isomerase [Pseudoalteromonas sp.]|tara:strand:- start:2800 stop:3558 length:759 start_codon:yes stop_codon:yes gene_type:complete
MKKCLIGSLLAFSCFTSQATIVEMQTSHGVIELNLFDQQAPNTVANFLSYIEDDAYNQTVIHRSVSDFVIQGGGFTFTDELVPITTKPAVVNEPVLSNVKGTIAMAKLANDENSATSQWFFNMVDNSEALDTQNGGFTVFGQITAQSQATLDNIAGLVHCGDIPLVDITSEQCSSSDVALSSANFVTINSVVVLDDDPLSSANLNPTANTLISQDDSSAEAGSSSSSGGSMGVGFCLIALLGVGKRLKRAKY